MHMNTTPCCPKEIPVTTRNAVDALVLHHLNPLLVGRQAVVERLERFRATGEDVAAKQQEMALLLLEKAYRDGLQLLRWVLSQSEDKEPVQ